MADFLEDQRRMIADRLNDLKPLVDEYARLEAAAAALASIPGSSSPARANGRKRPGRPRGTAAPVARKATTRKPTRPKATTKARATRGAGRRRGRGKRAAETLGAVQQQPGITIPEIAAKIGIKQNYLYRVLPGLVKEKKVKKDGKGWHATA